MADGDILRLGILAHYCDAYRQLCEGGAKPSQYAHEVADGLRKRIRWYRRAPQDLLEQMALEISNVSKESKLISRQQLMELDKKLECLRQSLDAPKEGLNLASEACRVILDKLKHGEQINDFKLAISQEFVNRVVETTFNARVSGVRSHLHETPFDVVTDRLEQMEIHFLKYKESFARQIAKNPSSKKLRFPPSRKVKRSVNLDDQVE